MRSMSARFMNCSSASTRAVYVFFCQSCAQKEKIKFKELSATGRALEGHRARTYAQKAVEIDAARVERAMEVINRVLDRVIFGDEVDESVG